MNNIKPKNEIISDDKIYLYDYWKVLVKRKKIFIGIFLVSLAIVTIINLNLPRYYRGESEISILAFPAEKIVKFIGNIDERKKNEIFANNSGAIKSVSILRTNKSTDKADIIIDARTVDIIPQAFKDIVDYFSNLPEIKGEIARIQEETDFKIKKLIEARKANLVFLSQITDMMKKKQKAFVMVNPSDLIKKDIDLSLEIMNLQKAKTDMIMTNKLNVTMKAGILGPLSITEQPSNQQIKQRIVIAGFLCFFTGIFVVFFLEYIDRMKAHEDK